MTEYSGFNSSRKGDRSEHEHTREQQRVMVMHEENQRALNELREMCRRIEAKTEACQRDCARFCLILEGPDAKPEEGLIVKHQWLNRDINRAWRVITVAVLTTLTAVATTIASYFEKHK